MRRFVSFYWRCIRRAASGCVPRANDWQWLIGFPVLGVAIWFVNRRYGEGTISLPQDTALGAFLAAVFAFGITWAFTFVAKLADAPVALFHEERNRADALQKQLGQLQPLQITVGQTGHYDQILDVALGRRFRKLRLGVKNIGDKPLSRCHLYLREISRPNHRTFPICLRNDFELNPGQEEYVAFGSYTHLPYVENHKRELHLSIPDGEGNDIGEIIVERPQTVWNLVFEANARESRPTIAHCRLWVDATNRWRLEQI
jgi:hypothetical protein